MQDAQIFLLCADDGWPAHTADRAKSNECKRGSAEWAQSCQCAAIALLNAILGGKRKTHVLGKVRVGRIIA